MVDVRIEGGDAFADLAKRLEKAASSDVVIQTLGRAIDAEVPAILAAIKVGASRLPQRGGLAALAARTPVARKVTSRHGFYGVRLTAQPTAAIKDPAALNRGRARHPTYGHQPWVVQLVKANWFTDPIKHLAPAIRRRLESALADAIRRI